MSEDIQQLISDVAEVTGSSAPAIMAADAPVFQAQPMRGPAGASIYFIGLIGGKDVGKSALINAIVGMPISESTAFGPGTETIVAYVHKSQQAAVKALLEPIAPGRFSIVTHAIDRLVRQVLLDLPDIDSQYGDHVALTRAMLRHLLFPIWVQSVEKYADRQPQELLAAVASGNDPANFLFALNKADQVAPQVVDELRADFAARIARTLKSPAPPKVFVLSAKQPDQFDFPQLRKTLSRQKSEPEVEQSMALAGRQRRRSMLEWISRQQLPQRVQRLERLAHQASELVRSRLTGPLLEEALPRILEDPSHRLAMVDEVMDARAARWPVVNMLNTLLSPLTALWRRNSGAAPTVPALVEGALTIQGRGVSDIISAAFAMLQQTHPAISKLYRTRRLWESAGADAAARELRESLVASLEQQRALAMRRIARRGVIAPVVRWLLTLGAILWFPIIQPIGAMMLNNSLAHTLRGALVLIFELFSATYLLRSAAFLSLWFIFLWMALRWDTQRRVRRLINRWRALESRDGGAHPSAAMVRWSDELLDPIHLAAERERALVRRAEEFRGELEKPAA